MQFSACLSENPFPKSNFISAQAKICEKTSDFDHPDLVSKGGFFKHESLLPAHWQLTSKSFEEVAPQGVKTHTYTIDQANKVTNPLHYANWQ